MLLLCRPAEHPDFDADVKDARVAVAKAVLDGTHPIPFDEDLWKKYRKEFFRAQHGKCGYCEIKLAGQVGQMDHFRPKGAVYELHEDEELWGHEDEDDTTFRGRGIARKSLGYHWLAYSWENYVLSCERCNAGLKRSYFPVVESPRCWPPKPDVHERACLINPFDGPNPVEHLEFTILGTVAARGEGRYGIETIRTLGLNRPSLVEVREETARKMHYSAQVIVSDEFDDRAKQEALTSIAEFADAKRAHAGMARIIFEQLTSISWDHWEQALQVVE
jgi:hypothetical protein